MLDERRARLKAEIREAIDEPRKRQALYTCMKRGRDKRAERLEILPGGTAFRAEAKAIKERCIEKQDELLTRFRVNAEKRGVHVYVARTAADAIAYTLRVAERHGYKNVSKSKSLTTEEIEINEDMERAGLNVVETDLGELIIQLVGDKPFHLVFPSVHKMKEDVAAIFGKATGKQVEPDIPAIMKVVRSYLKPVFLNTDIGMTGANIGVAETGGIVIETNEGNGRLVSSIGKCHICIMGMEKIVETMEDALTLVLAHPVSAVGQLPTTYVTWMGGRNPLGAEGEPRESHYIILDNGRTRMREDPIMHEALHCIRCGACMNICPTYGVAGGHTFGYIYPGPIGIPWTAEVHGLEKAGRFAELCISCGLCKEICPADIDMPLMIAEVKRQDMQIHPPPMVNRVMMAAERSARMGSAFAPFSNWMLRRRTVRWLMERTMGIDRRRTLPAFAQETFAAQFRKRRPHAVAPDPNERQVVFFHDLFANYNAPELAWRAVEEIEALGYTVVVPEQRGCGYPYIGYGDLDKAREVAGYNITCLAPYARAGAIIVTPEPTAAYCLMQAWPKLLHHRTDARIVAAQTRELFAFFLEQDGAAPPQTFAGKRYGFHIPCHERPLDNGRSAIEWVRRRGGEVEVIESGTCCGMGGTYGMKAGTLGYDLSNAVGEPLFQQFRTAEIAGIITESSVCSMHLRDGTGLPVQHPLMLLEK
ncbi:MAG: LUD domain-containing protein [Candidatus Hydrogenedentes bacterium]|nr:LUD domain-containing protein [Candidatus Hydrogenedentota bacterium]